MKYAILILLGTASLMLSGCGKKEPGQNPSFMFWCFREENVTSDYRIPDMKTDTAATYIRNRIKTIPGYVESQVDLNNHTLSITYASSTIRKMNFEEAIALSGFSVNNRPANPNAKLPAGIK